MNRFPAALAFARASTLLLAAAALIGCATTAPAAAEADPGWSYLRAKYDRDGDGTIAPAEHARGAQAFARLDRNGDGVITQDDFRVAATPPPDLVAPMGIIRIFGPERATSVTLDEVASGFARVDADGDGRIVRADLEGRAPSPELLASLFLAVDRDRDGAMTLEEVRAYFVARDRDGNGRLVVRERMEPGKEPRVGWIPNGEREPAPELTLVPLGGGAPVSLASFRGAKPVALIFGSMT